MNSVITQTLLPAALAVVMAGLGLSLTAADFRRVARHPKVVTVSLLLQLVLLPAVCFGITYALGLSPVLATGMMLLAASPGGTVANVFSHLFHGDVALNVTLTAINSVIAVVTVPAVVEFALWHFQPDLGEDGMGLQFTKLIQVFAVVLIPVALGMLVRRSKPDFAERLDRPVRLVSTVVLALVVLVAVFSERVHLGGYFASVGLAALVFCLVSLAVGFWVPRALGVRHRQAVAAAFEIGAHNATLAMTLAMTTLGSVRLAIPAAVYAMIMIPVTAAFGWALTCREDDLATAAPSPAEGAN
ncbi:bile acid:sodium symporter family protein [Streptomyces sp. NPDC051784]|uniref:bile acid:sodium symporter family protein n=1 Tax=Streptomyces sp. NPDC051784 TaxID=3155805 RepID=UPI00343AB7D2